MLVDVVVKMEGGGQLIRWRGVGDVTAIHVQFPVTSRQPRLACPLAGTAAGHQWSQYGYESIIWILFDKDILLYAVDVNYTKWKMFTIWDTFSSYFDYFRAFYYGDEKH